jgi:hypothetical protein
VVSGSDRLSQNLPQLHTVELIIGKGIVQQVSDMPIEACGFAVPIDHREAFTTASKTICPLYTPVSKLSEARRIHVPLNLRIQTLHRLLMTKSVGGDSHHAQVDITVMATLAATRPCRMSPR